jgi:putative ABC transport system permease protein
MPRIRAWFYRLIGLLGKNRRDAEMAEEIQQHIDLLIERNMAAGMSPGEARHVALREFGGVEQIKQIAREQRVWMWPDQLWQDVRFGVRMLWRSPGFSLLAILCLTLGIGTNAAVFSWIEGILFHPYPAVEHEDRMFALAGTTRGASPLNLLSYPDCIDFQRSCTLIESFIVAQLTATTLSIGDRAERAVGGIVTANYFDAIGVRPILGRGFKPEEDVGRKAHPVVVISYEMWQNRYQGDPAIIGKTQYLNGVQHIIIGVTPEKFRGTFVGVSFQFWVPMSMQETFDATGYKLEDRSARWFESYVFLKPGVTVRQAQNEISAVAKRLENDYPETNRGYGVQLLPLWKSPFNVAAEIFPALKIGFAVALFVLLIACANVSNLLLVRSLLREHEMTTRLALGAGRSRLLQQLLTEGVILSALATAGGILVAHWCRNALVLAFPPQAPGIIINLPGEIDWRVLALSAGVCIVATLLFALTPAIQASKVDLAGAIKAGSLGVVGGRGRSRLRSIFVLIQISLSFVLLASGCLLLQSLQRIQNASPGFSTQNVLISGVALFSAGYDVERTKRFEDQLLEHVRAIPGVESAAFARVTPFGFRDYSSAPITIDGYQTPPDERPRADYNEVSPDYFAVMGIPIVAGREFNRNDDEKRPLVAVVDETMAARYWPGKDPIGQRFRVKDRWMEVVGVAKLSHYRTKLETPNPFFYVPLRQNFAVQGALFIRTWLSTAAMMQALAREVHALDPNLAPEGAITMEEHLRRMSYTQRLPVTLLAIFGGMALLLAAVGLYGVMSYAVSQSTRELGLRMALGASASDLLRLVMSRGIVLTVGGVIIGSVVALALTRLIANQLYEVSPYDPVAFASAFLVMTIVALVACFFPAWRATRIDPAHALRV